MQIARRSRKFDNGPIPLTQKGIDALHEKLAYLKRVLPERIAETQRTAAYGDRSDSAEYKEAKGILRATHRQIFSIEDQLKRVVLIELGPDASGTVQLGSTVVIEEQSNGDKKTFQILGPQETNPGNGRISHKSPLGAALIGRKKGETVLIETANGPRKYLILNIKEE